MANAESSSNATAQESSTASWSELLAELIRGFVLLRDVFGYVLPGLVFLLIGWMLNGLGMFLGRWRPPDAYSHPWLLVLALLVISYLVGQVLVATSYLHKDVPSVFRWCASRLKRRLDPHAASRHTLDQEKAKTEKTRKAGESDFLLLHRSFSEIYVEYDRQSIIALLRRGLAASILLAILVFRLLQAHPLRVLGAAGLIMAFNAFANNIHLGNLYQTTLRAARSAAKLPDSTD